MGRTGLRDPAVSACANPLFPKRKKKLPLHFNCDPVSIFFVRRPAFIDLDNPSTLTHEVQCVECE